ncbi:MAG: peptide chain release factor N(5)-glutamine methyltransferase [Candidatus Symbiobacter sp.]|nr:peptide chain release factor N(5)-glutamine methyltransferase [Candidatus Symbiobacter sp.]
MTHPSSPHPSPYPSPVRGPAFRPGTIGDAVIGASALFHQAGVAMPRLDAQILLAAITGKAAAGLVVMAGDERLTAAQIQQFHAWVERRCRREPVSHIIGRREFWSLEFAVSAATLDPRPDSEILVAAALDHCEIGFRGCILDLGTGSGCLILAWLSERPAASGIGLDQSQAAIAVAEHNARQLHLASRVQFQLGDWQEFRLAAGAKADLVIANPPYIRHAELTGLAPELAFDPILALDGGPDGLTAYRQIIARQHEFLRPGGKLLFEIGWDQADAVEDLLRLAGLGLIEKRRDLAGCDRVLVAQSPEAGQACQESRGHASGVA